jgi:hypothetical protein
MKTTFVFLLMACLSGTAFAQLDFDVKLIPAEEVPEAVQASQAKYFPSSAVIRWEKQIANGRKNSAVRYAASFRGANKQLTRARYMKDGTGIKASTVYTSITQFPSAIQTAITHNYSNYKLMGGQKVELLSKGKSFFRLHLRRGVRSNPFVYLNSEGEEISTESIPLKVREE